MGGLDAWVRDRFSHANLTEGHLHQYQQDAKNFMYDNPFSALFLDTGLGKTGACIKLIHQLVLEGQREPTLVIGPLRVAGVTWPDELREWTFGCPLNFRIIRDGDLVESVNAAGQEARRIAKLNGADENGIKLAVAEARHRAAQRAVRTMMIGDRSHVHLINQEQVEFLVEAWGKDWPYKVVIIDESSSLKDPTTNRWKALWKIRKLIKRMHQLTATPASETYLHLYAQITLLDRGERFGTSYNKYKERFFTYNQYSRKHKLRPGAEEEITQLISDICIVMKQEDYLDLQQPVPVYHPVKLDAKQLALYRQMESEFIVELPAGEVVEAETASALSQKLLQMASGVLYDTISEEVGNGDFKDKRVVYQLHDHKIDALRQLHEEINGENMLVAYWHQSSLDRLLKAFPKAKVMDKDGKLIAEWNKGKIPILLLHPMSGSHGLNLQRGGRHVVFFDIPWSYERYYQFYRRLARQGQKYLVLIHHLVATGTKDEMVAQCLRDKRDGQEMLFRWINRMRRKLAKLKRERAAMEAFTDNQDIEDEL